jgi:tRNA (guanine-N7-)-methyltransferase
MPGSSVFGGRPTGDRGARSFTIRRGRRGPQKEHSLAELVPKFSIVPGREPLNLDREFGYEGPLIIDVGFGSGHTTLSLAEHHQDACVVGIETHENGLAQLCHEVDARNLTNVRVLAADAFDVFVTMVPLLSVQIIQLVCPDPWPKSKQQHRRLFNSAFARICAERLVVGGELRLATDHAQYADQMLEVCEAESLLRNMYPTWAPRNPERPTTNYERKGLAAGRSMKELLYRRT